MLIIFIALLAGTQLSCQPFSPIKSFKENCSHALDMANNKLFFRSSYWRNRNSLSPNNFWIINELRLIMLG